MDGKGTVFSKQDLCVWLQNTIINFSRLVKAWITGIKCS